MNNTIINYVGEASLERVFTLIKAKLGSMTIIPITSQEITALFNGTTNE